MMVAEGRDHGRQIRPAASWRDSIVPAPPSTCLHSEGEAQPERWRTWAELMKRAFDVDVLLCPHCGGVRRLISLITDPTIIHRILAHLRLPLEFPSVAPSRAPPESSIPF